MKKYTLNTKSVNDDNVIDNNYDIYDIFIKIRENMFNAYKDTSVTTSSVAAKQFGRKSAIPTQTFIMNNLIP